METRKPTENVKRARELRERAQMLLTDAFNTCQRAKTALGIAIALRRLRKRRGT